MSTALCITHLRSLDDNAFEEWLCLYFQVVYDLRSPPQRNGRSGQAQAGVDIMFCNADGEWFGVQAKAYTRTILTPAMLDKEIKSAHAFAPPLSHFVVCTLNDRDAGLQAHARGAIIHGKANVSVLAVQDLAEEASRRSSLTADLLKRADSGYLDAIRQFLQPSPTPALAAATPDSSFIDDQTLRAIGAWTEGGSPRRALEELAAYTGVANPAERLLVEVRARFALRELDQVIRVARDEASEAQPSALLLAVGAQAAALLSDWGSADVWLAQALAVASAEEKPQVVGAYLRVQAQRDGSKFGALEQFAASTLGDALPVALALADSAFQIGDLDAALGWYERARKRQAHWPLGAHANELGARIWKLIAARDAGGTVDTQLRDCASQLASILTDDALRAASMRQPLLINLGHARRVLGDFHGAAIAWDEALELPDAPPALWLHRCVLSASEGIPLPSEDLIQRWATTHIASLVLASACTTLGNTERASSIIDAVLADPTTSSNDRVVAQIECIRLASASDKRVTPNNVETMLALVDPKKPSLPLFAWLTWNFQAATGEQGSRVRAALVAMAAQLPLDGKQRVALAGDLLRSKLNEVAVAWLSDIEREAWADQARVTQRDGALVLLRMYAWTFRFDDARRLVAQLTVQFPQDASVALHCAIALYCAGDRLGAYEFLTAAIQRGIHDGDVIGNWARLAVMLKRRREAHRLLRDLQLTPRDPREYGQLLQTRALLGLRGSAGLKLTPASEVTPDNAGVLFSSGLLYRASKSPSVVYGCVVHLRIADGDAVRFDRDALLLDRPGNSLPGVVALTTTSCPWIAELIGAQVGETRTLTTAPFVGQNATIIDVVEADQWSIKQAAQLLRVLPPISTGVEAISGDIEALRNQLSQKVNANRRANEEVLTSASEQGVAISVIAAALHSSPRALLRACLPWHPTGHPGTTEEIDADDHALINCTRVVLDPVTLLLMVDIGAESLLAALPVKPVMTLQAVWQLFDWWYERERHHRGMVAHAVASADGSLVFVPVTTEWRRATQAFWQRVLNAITRQIELLQPPALDDPELRACVSVLGTPVISGMALAAAQGWAYVTEEAMLRAVATHIAHTNVGSVHRLLVVGAARGWWRQERTIAYLTTLMKHGWSWISFPVSMLDTALRLPAAQRRPTVELLLSRIKRADPAVSIGSLFVLLRDLDRGVYPSVDVDHLRRLIASSLPSGVPRKERLTFSRIFTRKHPGRLHRASRRCVERWANRA